VSALAAVEGSALAQALKASLWLYPAVETLHILGFSLLFGAIAVYDLRVLRGGGAEEARRIGRIAVPAAAAGLALAAAAGALLFTVEATRYAANDAFRWKIALIALALANVAWAHAAAGRGAAAARAGAAASLVLWAAVLAAGRLVAYL
jgi:hypothetical protein